MRCPRCGQQLALKEQRCANCSLGLLPGDREGIRIAVAPPGDVLCKHCAYREDCTLPDFPEARRCTLYRDEHLPAEPAPVYQSPIQGRLWSVPLVVGLLVLLSLLLALKP